MVIIDTSAWIEALRDRGDTQVKSKIAEFMSEDRARFCDPVILELKNTSPRGAEKSKFISMISLVPCFPATSAAWERAGNYAEKLRTQGISVPAIGILIRAIADENRATCFSLDGDFQVMENALS